MAKKQDGFKPTEQEAEQTADEILYGKLAHRAESISQRLGGVPVTPFVFYDPADKEKTDPVIGFLKDPDLQVKIRVLDKSSALGDFAGSYEMLQLCLVTEDSDPRISSTKHSDHKYVLGACFEAQQLIQIALSQFKKK